MITFYNELPLDHKKSLTSLAFKWADEIYEERHGDSFDSDNEYAIYDGDYCYEQAWNSMGKHLWNEGHMINIPVDKTFLELVMSNHGYENINGIYKDADCQHCGDEWEYQCYECEKAEREMSDE